MRSETRDRLERTIRRQRLARLAVGGLAAVAFAVVLALASLDMSVESHQVTGHIERVAALTTKDARSGLAVDVALDDGRHVHVLALKTTDPHVGDRVSIAEHHHASGRSTFSWR